MTVSLDSLEGFKSIAFPGSQLKELDWVTWSFSLRLSLLSVPMTQPVTDTSKPDEVLVKAGNIIRPESASEPLLALRLCFLCSRESEMKTSCDWVARWNLHNLPKGNENGRRSLNYAHSKYLTAVPLNVYSKRTHNPAHLNPHDPTCIRYE